MTKMVATPFLVKTCLNLQNQKADELGPWYLCSIEDVGPTKFVHMMILGCVPYQVCSNDDPRVACLLQGQICFQVNPVVKWIHFV